MAKKKTNPKLVSKVTKVKGAKKVENTTKGEAKEPSGRSLGTKRGNTTRKEIRHYGQYLRKYGNVMRPERIRKQYYKRGEANTDKAIGETYDRQHNLRVPGPSYAPKWMPENLRKTLLSVVKNNRDRIFGRGGLLEDAITNTNGRAKSLGDGLVYVNMNKDAGIRKELGAKGGENRELRISAEALSAFMDYKKAYGTFKDANGRVIAVPTSKTDVKKMLTKLLYLIPFGPDGKTF